MNRKSTPALLLALLIAAAGGVGSAGCGSDSDGANETGPAEQSEQIVPAESAPSSAEDESKEAPDAAISDRPGGPGTSTNP